MNTKERLTLAVLVLSGGVGGSYINLGNGITTITSDLSETALAVGLMENNVQDAIGFIISNSSAMNQMYGTTTGINTTSDINMSGHSITNLKHLLQMRMPQIKSMLMVKSKVLFQPA